MFLYYMLLMIKLIKTPIFFLGIIRATDSENLDKSLENVNANNVVLTGRVVSSKEISNNELLKMNITQYLKQV